MIREHFSVLLFNSLEEVLQKSIELESEAETTREIRIGISLPGEASAPGVAELAIHVPGIH